MTAPGKNPDMRQVRSKEYRDGIEKKVRKLMSENPGISMRDLRPLVQCENGVLSTIYHRVLRERQK